MDKFITVTRPATISQSKALEGLASKYPAYHVVSFQTEKLASAGERVFTAKLKLSEFPPVGTEAKDEEQAETTETPMVDEAPLPEEEDIGPDKKERTDSEKLDELISLVHELVSDEAGEYEHGGDDLGPEEGPPGGAPMGGPAPRALPSPVKPHMDGGGASQMPAFAKRKSFVSVRSDDRDEHGCQMTVKQLVNEANREYGPYGFRVAKIERRGAKVVTHVKRV